MQKPGIGQIMATVAKLNRERRSAQLSHQHMGDSRLLVREGTRAWRYYMITPQQIRFWRSLNGIERSSIVRKSRGCFVCALEEAIERRKQFEDGLHGAMMSYLLSSPG
jgi:hypothetical protein